MPGSRRLPADQRRAQLLDAALRLAAGGDLAAVSVQELAATAGVSEGLLYHYFPTKQALVLAAVTRAAEALLADLGAATAAGTPAERMVAGLGAYLDHVLAQPTGWRAVLAASTGEFADLQTQLTGQTHQMILATLGVEKAGPALQVVLAGWSAFERDACVSWLEHPALSRDALVDLLLSTFVAALSSAARYDEQARAALARLEAGPA
jgi:AcrR family transcriptional regulator